MQMFKSIFIKKNLYYFYKKESILFLLCFFLSLSTLLILNLTAPKIPILGFHSIIDPNNQHDRPFLNSKFNRMNYNLADFYQLVDYLASENFWFLSSSELYEYFAIKSKAIPRERIGQKPIMLSFDDGYKNNYTHLIPMLEGIENKYAKKVKIVVFVNPGTLANYQNDSSIHMTCNDLREGLKKGFYDVQSHGLTHKKLTEINNKDLIIELAQAQTELRRCTADLDPEQKVGSHIAYPFGAANRKVENYAAKYYDSGYLYNSRMMKMGWLRSYYQISRLTVNRNHTPSKLIGMANKALIVKSKVEKSS